MKNRSGQARFSTLIFRRQSVCTVLQNVVLLTCVVLFMAACSERPDANEETPQTESAIVEASFQGADYSTESQKLSHGERLATVLGCNACHMSDYSGANFGEMIPLVDGLWATNISLTMPEMSDDDLKRLLREGIHPTREMYLMPSKQSQFLSRRDMSALIAYLRTIPPTGEPTPPPPPGFEEAVTERLPDDYWRTLEDGQPRSYHNSAEEADYYAEHAAPDLGDEYAQGRLVALTLCSSCHGAALDGVGEPAGDIQSALNYDRTAFERLLKEGIGLDGEPIEMNWGSEHSMTALTESEIQSVISYTMQLAKSRASENR